MGTDYFHGCKENANIGRIETSWPWARIFRGTPSSSALGPRRRRRSPDSRRIFWGLAGNLNVTSPLRQGERDGRRGP